MSRLVLINPEDRVNVADAKAIAAQYDTSVQLNVMVPLGKILVLDTDTFAF